MKFGICGYGNLGKAVEKTILNSNDEIVGIFSRRQIKSQFNTKVYPYADAQNFVGKIDAMIMCGGSQEDLLWQSLEMAKYFNIIDTFDTHAKILKHKQNLNLVCKKSGTVAISSCGWDPGLFSLIRIVANSVFKNLPQTFWGKGVSQGHSEALRNIPGIMDAIQFTVPQKDVIKQIKANPSLKIDENSKHIRMCYICLDGTRPENEIKNQILNTDNYFKGQNVQIEVCSYKKIQNLKKKMYHKGAIFAGDSSSHLQFYVDMANNPEFTSKIVYAYSKALPKLKSGAYSVLDIPPAFIALPDGEKLI